MNIDHVVLWVSDPKAALEFYESVVGFAPVRAEEFAAGTVPFPSVRVNDQTILDLMGTGSAGAVQDFTGGSNGSAGNPVNHMCLAMSADEYSALAVRLGAAGIELTFGGDTAFGAQGTARKSTYFADPDGNVIEIRYYD